MDPDVPTREVHDVDPPFILPYAVRPAVPARIAYGGLLGMTVLLAGLGHLFAGSIITWWTVTLLILGVLSFAALRRCRTVLEQDGLRITAPGMKFFVSYQEITSVSEARPGLSLTVKGDKRPFPAFLGCGLRERRSIARWIRAKAGLASDHAHAESSSALTLPVEVYGCNRRLHFLAFASVLVALVAFDFGPFSVSSTPLAAAFLGIAIALLFFGLERVTFREDHLTTKRPFSRRRVDYEEIVEVEPALFMDLKVRLRDGRRHLIPFSGFDVRRREIAEWLQSLVLARDFS